MDLGSSTRSSSGTITAPRARAHTHARTRMHTRSQPRRTTCARAATCSGLGVHGRARAQENPDRALVAAARRAVQRGLLVLCHTLHVRVTRHRITSNVLARHTAHAKAIRWTATAAHEQALA